MREKCASKELRLIERIVDRDGDDLHGREILRAKLRDKSHRELERIWEGRERA